MDASLFDPRAPNVTKGEMIHFLKKHETEIHLRSSLTKLDPRRRSSANLPTAARNITRTSPRLSSPRTEPAVNPNIPGSDTRLRARRGSPQIPGIVQALWQAPLTTSPATITSVGDGPNPRVRSVPSSTPETPALVGGEPQDHGGLATLLAGGVVQNVKANDLNSTEWTVIEVSEVSSKTNTGEDILLPIRVPGLGISSMSIESPTVCSASLHETQQLPGAFPVGLPRSLPTYPPRKIHTDAAIPLTRNVIGHISAMIPFSGPVVTSASKQILGFVNNALLKLCQLSIARKPSNQTSPSNLDDCEASSSVTAEVEESILSSSVLGGA
ncbi:uncharacterized protein PGTG_09746 [Puccinia graminis f. sp. tritici CRL 75-36-700-3]|uniref:Uncharacterized protein n=1 Tax=Puccinia graminis f. sp. tritici (strain CRL 75-36-700-3 / race SCCL) TaxID=418459 RepID=E3KIA8_PUCGT|nr:uncharacterized protein PGTG_09746 [Puccinia graminis f. sp. tritici CRL 75-36-700-3]EFP84033.2 hypothetical protein PGTG_09746 [Puccinia graminis f. sp. tritici CRL 75-36-700-3]